jgi:hypothetical protein
MLRKLMRYSLLPAMALALVVGACDQVGEVTGPGASAPLFEESESEGFTVVKEKDASVGTVAGVIGSAGGKLVLGKHELWVPQNAVSGATTFSMTKLDGQLRFELTATQLLTNDIGSSGFAVPVKLVVSFKDASDQISDPSKLRIFWKKLDGTLEAQQTEVDVVGKKAIGYLSHFSEYVLAMP